MKKQNGFTLFEVLIAIVILAVGLLGVASLQTNGVRSNHSAYLRSQATVLAYEIIDKMRANRDRDKDKLDGLSSYITDFDNTISSPPDCRSSSCGEADMIASDLAEWKSSLQTLPSGSGAVAIDVDEDVVIAEISVRWDDTRGSGSLTTFTTQTRL